MTIKISEQTDFNSNAGTTLPVGDALIDKLKELYRNLFYHYSNLSLLYEFASGEKNLKTGMKNIRKPADDHLLLETVANLQNQITVLEDELHFLIKTFR